MTPIDQHLGTHDAQPSARPHKATAPGTAARRHALETLAAVTDESILMIDGNFTIRLVNPALTQLIGWNEDVIGRSCQEVIRCSDERGVPHCGTVQCPLFAARPPSKPRESSNVTLTTAQGGTFAAQVSAVTTTPKKRGERLLLVQSASMRQHDAFLSEISHKLRNRLNSIHGFVELVASGHAGRLAPRQRQLLTLAHTSSVELMEYMENLLYLTRLDAGDAPLTRDAINPRDLIEEAEHYTALDASTAGITIKHEIVAGLPMIYGDRGRLRQAIMNLVMNALRFTSEGGVVRLVARREGDQLKVQVIDTGEGISPEDLPYIFDRSFQSATSTNSGGGLGLAAARAIAEQHGGSLIAESTQGQGATFTLMFPLTQSQG